ncbi:uncharacterized protein K02A2.6 [Trichonephila clavata]|uniref:Uncharacterized protein K02A2.6 n=1 Tax=Trichonephila clavata TaxID=2740835 RepID=A0A8X6M4F9_TRICU|nr:uncharacterized protein K02A2.6 [Trichonephila clavata]
MALNVQTRSHQELYLSSKKNCQIDKEALSIVWAVKKFYLYLKGRRFTLIMDHKPLSFEFDIIFRKTIEHGKADFLSWIPKILEELEAKDDITIFQMSQIETLPVTSKELRQKTDLHFELGPLLKALRSEQRIGFIFRTKSAITYVMVPDKSPSSAEVIDSRDEEFASSREAIF